MLVHFFLKKIIFNHQRNNFHRNKHQIYKQCMISYNIEEKGSNGTFITFIEEGREERERETNPCGIIIRKRV